ncbi:uncharacterized protein METZ01_LOCUS425718, partial [marine metagenome]
VAGTGASSPSGLSGWDDWTTVVVGNTTVVVAGTGASVVVVAGTGASVVVVAGTGA